MLDRYLPLAEVTNRQMAPLFVVSGNGEHEPVARSGDKFLEWNGISTPAVEPSLSPFIFGTPIASNMLETSRATFHSHDLTTHHAILLESFSLFRNGNVSMALRLWQQNFVGEMTFITHDTTDQRDLVVSYEVDIDHDEYGDEISVNQEILSGNGNVLHDQYISTNVAGNTFLVGKCCRPTDSGNTYYYQYYLSNMDSSGPDVSSESVCNRIPSSTYIYEGTPQRVSEWTTTV